MTPVFRTLIGSTNGANRIFETPTEFAPGTVRVAINGFILDPTQPDGWIEIGRNRIQMKEAPLSGDVLQAFYISV